MHCPFLIYRISGVIVSVLASSVVDREFELESKTIKLVFVAKHAALRRKHKDWLSRSQDNVSKWDDMSNRGLWFQ